MESKDMGHCRVEYYYQVRLVLIIYYLTVGFSLDFNLELSSQYSSNELLPINVSFIPT